MRTNRETPSGPHQSCRFAWTPSQVAQISLIDRTTVRTYYRNYKKGGVNRLLEINYSQHRGHLSLEQQHALDAYLQKSLHITVKSIVAYVEERWNVRYSESGMTDLLHQLGYIYKKPPAKSGWVRDWRLKVGIQGK